MNLDFSDDQKFLQSEARKFLEKEGSINRSRKVLEDKQSIDKELWNKIVELGWTGIRIPEEYGGLGLGHLELCVVAEELGRYLAPVPFSSSVYLFTEAIIKYADAVPDAGIATHSLVVSNSTSGICLRLVDHSSDSVIIEHQDTIDESRGHFSVEYNNTPSILIGDDSNGWDFYENLLDQAAVLFSFEQIGGSQASLDMATSYAKERYAFGRQIGSFQAIKHKLADMYVAITLAKSNSYYAAWALSTDSSDLSVASATARVSSTKAFQLCSKENIQTHGGNGFTWEYDCHLYYKRSKLLSVNIGSLPNWKEKLVSGLEKSNTY